MKKEPKVFLSHILESIEEIQRNTKNLELEKFLKETTIQDAVIRRLAVIGEAAKNLPKSLKQQYSKIEWRKVAGLRDVIVHEYFGLSLKLIWKITQTDIPELRRDVKKILEVL